MKIEVGNLTYYLGWFLLPACSILCLLEFIYCLNEKKEKFYFIESLKWFIHLETPQEVLRVLFILIISVVCTIVILIFTTPVQAQISNDCEELALNYQFEHGGSLIFMNPLKSNGAYELCRYCGHWINYAHGKYYDVESNTTLSTEQEVKLWYKWNNNKKVEIWDVSIKHPPFRLIRN